MTYTTVAIIYNPNSTGSSKTLAQDFKKNLQERIPKQKVELIATKYAGHAEKLVYNIAKESKNAIVFSSSGDGGYNEVVNGAMKAQNEGFNITTGLLPAGNANDHWHNLHTKDVIDLIVAEKPKQIDLLKISYIAKSRTEERYAHSYIGFGLSPIVGKELNKTKLNKFNETWLVVRAIFTLHPVRLKIHTEPKKYDSVIISNVDKMSKYLNVSSSSSTTDGKFEVTISKHENKFKLIALLVRASLMKLEENQQTNTFSLETMNKTTAQADGEILTIDQGTKVVITSEKKILSCFV